MMHLPEIRARAEPPRLWKLLRSTIGAVSVDAGRLVEKPGDFAPSDEALLQFDFVRAGGTEQDHQIARQSFLADGLRMDKGCEDRLFNLAKLEVCVANY